MTVYNEVAIYHRLSTLEWATKYYWGGTLPPSVAEIEDLATAEAELIKGTININRYEIFTPGGTKISEGGLVAIVGAQTGNQMPIHYCLLLREVAPANKRPSVKYIHGYTIGAINPDGFLSSAYTDLIDVFSTFLASRQWVDSDGGAISGVVFREFSRRKKMRQITE